MEKTKVVVFGMGQVAKVRHIEGYGRNKDSEVVAVFDRNPERKAQAEDLGVNKFYSDIDRLYQEVDFDAVSICTPPFTHKEMTINALENKKHVLCEKPISMSPVERAEIEEVLTPDLVFSTCHNFLYGKAMTKLKKLQAKGGTGEVIGATAMQWSSWNRRLPTWYDKLPGGLFYDEGPHLLYMIEHFLGELKVVSSSFDKSQSSVASGENVTVVYEGEKGVCQMSMWFGAPQSEWMLAVGFEKGTAIIDLFRDILIFLPYEKARNYRYILEVPLRATAQEWGAIVKWIAKRFSSGRHLYGHQKIIDDFICAIRGGAAPEISYKDGYRILGVMHDSLRMGGVIK